MPDTNLHPLAEALKKFWAPVPWMLEAAVVLQLALRDYPEAGIIAALLLFNALLGLLQESRAQATLTALRSRLALTASVIRDGAWAIIPASTLVPGDLVKLSLGGVVAADVRLVSGGVLLDQSLLTGESIPIDAGPGFLTFAGALVRRGEATAEVTATGPRTKFGRTAELVRTAQVESSQQKAVLRVVRNLAAFNGVVTIFLVGYAHVLHMPLRQIIPLVLTALLASIPVALPATFTLASSIGARALASRGVLLTRLSAVDEAASMNVLCADKTGTLTQNTLQVSHVQAMPQWDSAHVLALAALASSEGGQDPVDQAIRAAAAAAGIKDAPTLISFEPFDPDKKMSQALVMNARHDQQRILKGAFAVVAGLAKVSPEAQTAAEELEAQGLRVLAIAYGPENALRLIGLVALSDPPRGDSVALINDLKNYGIRTVMVTGDAPATAAIVAKSVGLDGPVCPANTMPDSIEPATFAVYAGVLPEDKFKLVKLFQHSGNVVGMCGDGANDAPALRQAHLGIAVRSATDVAKSAAGMVLTDSGLSGILAAVREGRIEFQRIQTYTLNSIIKKLTTVMFLTLGLIITGHAILTPLLMVLMMVIGDFLAMALTTDHVRPSPAPNLWHIGALTRASILLAVCLLSFCISVVAFGKFEWHLSVPELQSLTFVTLVFSGQATIYAIRDRTGFLGQWPSKWVAGASLADIAIACVLAVGGYVMAAVPVGIVAAVLGVSICFAMLLAWIKIPIFRRLGIV